MSPPESETSDDHGDQVASDSPDDARVDPAEAFAALSDPLRVDILRALAANHRESGPEPVGFADLRKRVEVRDSGRFRYHLNELRDHFVEKAESGYRLTTTGLEIVAAILAGTYTDRASIGPAPLDSDCTLCDSPAVAVYEDGVCTVTCENDHLLFQWTVPPAVTTDATLPEVVSLAELFAHQAIERALAGICPKCSAPIELCVAVDGDREGPGFHVTCDTCGARLFGPVGFCLFVDPGVAAFYRRHDRPLDDQHMWEPAFVADDSTLTVTETNPVRVAVSVSLDDETLAVTVDETGQVVSVDREMTVGE